MAKAKIHCSVPKCTKTPASGAVCEMHRARWRRLGRFDLPSFAEKFWRRVDKSGGKNACWPWLGYKMKSGHGRVYRNRRLDLSHRVAWELTNGPIPDGLDVCHHCDNGCCCNPTDLFVGTHTDNMVDKEKKGRGNHARGETSGMSKLTDRDILAIRRIKKSGKTNVEIARMFPVAASAISKICRRVMWRHIR